MERCLSNTRLRNLHNFSGQVSVTLATNVVITALGLITGVLAARLLGPSGRGELAAVQLWGSFVSTFALLGLQDAVLYFAGRDPSRAGSYWVTGVCCVLICGAPILFLGQWLLPWILSAQKPAVIALTHWYSVALFLLFIINWIPLGVLRGCGHIFLWNALRLLPSMGWLLVFIIAIFCNHTTLQFLAVGFLVSYAATALLTLPKVASVLAPPYSLDIKLCPQMIRFGLPSVTGDVPGYLLQGGRIAQLFVAAVLNPAALGYLAVGVAIGNVMRMIPEAVSSVVFPRVAAASPEDKASELAKGTRTAVFCIVLSVAVTLLLCPWLVPLVFGESFSSATHLSMIMVISGGIEGLKVVLNGGLRGLGRPSNIFQGELLAIALTMGGLPSFLHHLGVEGAGIALVLGNIASVLFLLRAVTLATGESLWSFVVPSIVDLLRSGNFLKNYQN